MPPKPRWDVIYREEALEDLRRLRGYDLRRIRGAIEANLVYEPMVRTKNRKPIRLVSAEGEVHETWELRVGEYRVFYDPDPEAGIVTIRWVRRKPPHWTTEDIL